MRRFMVLPLALLLAGCATEPQYVWRKPGSNGDDFQTDLGQCRAQAAGVAGASLLQIVIVQDNCLVGKGWRRTPV